MSSRPLTRSLKMKRLDLLQDLFLGDAPVGGNQPQDGIQRPNAQKSMSRDRHPLMARIFRLKDHVAADLVHDCVTPVLAQVLYQLIPSEISRQLHQRGEGSLSEGKALVAHQMQPDATRSYIKSIEEVSTHGIIDRSTHRGPVITLSHDRFRQALGDIAAIHFLRHLKDQLLHGLTHNLLSGLNQLRLDFHHSSASLGLLARPLLGIRYGRAS